jgi:hypothetical protein
VKSNSKNEIKMPWGLWQSLILTVSAFFVSMLVAAIVYISIDGFNLNDTEVNFIVYAFSASVMLLAATIFLKFKKVSLKYFFRLPNKKVFFQLPVYYLIYLLITIQVQFIMSLIPGYNPDQEQILGFVRHALTFVGGVLVAKGLASDGQVAEMIGSAMTLVGVVWSVLAKKA